MFILDEIVTYLKFLRILSQRHELPKMVVRETKQTLPSVSLHISTCSLKRLLSE